MPVFMRWIFFCTANKGMAWPNLQLQYATVLWTRRRRLSFIVYFGTSKLVTEHFIGLHQDYHGTTNTLIQGRESTTEKQSPCQARSTSSLGVRIVRKDLITAYAHDRRMTYYIHSTVFNRPKREGRSAAAPSLLCSRARVARSA